MLDPMRTDSAWSPTLWPDAFDVTDGIIIRPPEAGEPPEAGCEASTHAWACRLRDPESDAADASRSSTDLLVISSLMVQLKLSPTA